ncbi:MAG: hypothetical protein ACNA8W_01205 [Bradymonadaceae bacterium]
MMSRPFHYALIAVLLSLSPQLGCKSSPTINPFDLPDDTRDRDLLDDPVARGPGGAHRVNAEDGVEFMMPAASEEFTKEIDGNPKDWDMSRARTFAHERFVEVGAEAWRGPEDASFQVAIDADESFLYFFIEVTDDVLLNEPPHSPADGIVIWLRDPRLDDLSKSLPESFRENQRIKTETAIVFSPDGRFSRYGSDEPIVSQSVFAAASRTRKGYALEVALGMSILPQIAAMPMTEVAFRIEVLDGDNPDRPGVDKHLSMLPLSDDDDSPRYALFDLPGWLPHHTVASAPARLDALGVWAIGSDGWNFESIEFVVPNWRVLEDFRHVEKALEDRGGLPEICRATRNEIDVVEVYQSSTAAHRIALAVCGTPSQGARCASGARSQAVWIHLTPQARGNPNEVPWEVQSAIEIFDEPLRQCTSGGAGDDAHYSGFSLYPMTVISPSVWAVGWNKKEQTRNERRRESGVVFVDPQSSAKRVGALKTHQRSSKKDERFLRESRIYLTPIDNVEGLDICEVERIEEQSCTDFDQGCLTHERGRETLTYIRTWSPEKKVFEPYLLSRHNRCTARTTFGDIDGYKLLHVNQRIGLLPTKAPSN